MIGYRKTDIEYLTYLPSPNSIKPSEYHKPIIISVTAIKYTSFITVLELMEHSMLNLINSSQPRPFEDEF